MTRLTCSWLFVLTLSFLAAFGQCPGTEVSGSADDYTIFNTINKPDSALGVPDGNLTATLGMDDAILLDLTDTLPPGNIIQLVLMRWNDNGRASIQGSLDGNNFYDDLNEVGQSMITQVLTNVDFRITRPTRYVKITRTAGSMKLDGLSYQFCPDTDWDGIIDVDELASGSNRLDPCDPVYVSADYLDCDGDGVKNSSENSLDGLDPCVPFTFSSKCDEDGDGVSDAFDNCLGTPSSTIVNSYGCPTTLTCAYEPSPQSVLSPNIVWSSSEDIDAREIPLVGDVTGDGITDIVLDDYDDRVFVINGQTGATQYAINVPGSGMLNQNNSANAIGNVDNDIYGEIFVLRNDARWIRFDFDGTSWTSTLSATGASLADNNKYVPGLADFNGDGMVELFAGTQIWNADFDAAGQDILVDGGINYGDLGGSVAIDLLPDAACQDCEGLELVMSGRVFSVNLATASITQEIILSAVTGGLLNGKATSVADMDGDGDLDIVYSVGTAGNSRLIIWDGQTDLLMLNYQLNGNQTDVGRVNIADFDGDGYLEMGLHYGIGNVNGVEGEYIVLDDILTNFVPPVLWTINTNDASGFTGSTVFDFDGDGAAEVVYRDETELRILDGKDGTVRYLTPCRSGTRWEYPIVADANNDGTTNLICTCDDVGLSVFSSANKPWIPSRSVWNQHAYNVSNVNDDLTIPQVPSNNLTSAGGKFNNFLVQSAKLDSLGDPLPNADADGTITSVLVDNIACPDSMSFDISVLNMGDKALSPSTEISIYNGDPQTGGAILLGTDSLNMTIAPGITSLKRITLPSCPSGNIFFVLNDPGSLSPPYDYALDFPISSISECDYQNNDFNVSIGVLPLAFADFSARQIEEEIHLQWQTSFELNTDYFSIERSNDGQIFTKLGEVKSKGWGDELKTYGFIDRQPYINADKVYYRIKAIDVNGSYNLSSIVEMSNKTMQLFFQAYPIPARDILNLKLRHTMGKRLQLNIFNILGETIYQQELSPQNLSEVITVDVSNWTKGSYFIQMINEENSQLNRIWKE